MRKWLESYCYKKRKSKDSFTVWEKKMKEIKKRISSKIFIWTFIFALVSGGMFIDNSFAVNADMTVYITQTGSKYHTHKCGNGNYYPSDLTTARGMGLTAYSKCFPYGEPSHKQSSNSVYKNKSEHKKSIKPIEINKDKLIMLKGETAKLKIKNATQSIKWQSTKKSIVMVSSSGKIRALKAGKAVIIASVGKQKRKCKVRVESPKLNFKKVSMKMGANKVLKLKGCKHSIKWSSDDKYIVKVTKGKLKAISAGTTKIIAKVHGKKYTCKVTVKEPEVVNVTLNISNVNLKLHEKTSLQYRADPIIIPDHYDAIWRSENENVVRVENEYYNRADIYAVGVGETNIIMTVGQKTVKCHVIVQE